MDYSACLSCSIGGPPRFHPPVRPGGARWRSVAGRCSHHNRHRAGSVRACLTRCTRSCILAELGHDARIDRHSHGRGAVKIENGQTCTRSSSATIAISCGDRLPVEPEPALWTLTQQLTPRIRSRSSMVAPSSDPLDGCGVGAASKKWRRNLRGDF